MTAQIAASVKPRLKTRGPRRPAPRLFKETFALSHSKKTWRSADRLGFWRSSTGTLAIPRASKPASPSIRALILRSVEGTGNVGVVAAWEETSLESEVGADEMALPFSAKSSMFALCECKFSVPMTSTKANRFKTSPSAIKGRGRAEG